MSSLTVSLDQPACFCRRSTRQRKDVDYNEAHNLVSLDAVKLRGTKVDRVSYCSKSCKLLLLQPLQVIQLTL